MKIGIITFHAAINYGAVLQAYALTRFLKDQGHEPEMIQYYPIGDLAGRMTQRYWIWGLHPSDYLNAYRNHSFCSFRKKHLPETDRIFYSLDQLNQLEAYDAYICGSDQIWNPELTGGALDPAFFLSFAKGDVPRIAYAASSGGYAFPDQIAARELLDHLTHISVREQALAEPVERLSGKPVQSVLDPTLLPVDYTELVGKSVGDYILLYSLQENDTIYDQARALSRQTGLPIINLGSKVNPWKHPGRQRCSSPSGFVSLFHHARYVVTNSFHGTVFSVIFQRPFFCCALEGERSKRNVRMIDLLKSVGLVDQFFGTGSELFDDDVKQARSIQWDRIGIKLEQLRASSVRYLMESLASKSI